MSFSGHPHCDPAHDTVGLYQQSGCQVGGSSPGFLNNLSKYLSSHFRYFLILATVGHLSLLPLLFTGPELVSKLLLLISYSLLLVTTLYRESHMLRALREGCDKTKVNKVTLSRVYFLPTLHFNSKSRIERNGLGTLLDNNDSLSMFSPADTQPLSPPWSRCISWPVCPWSPGLS